ncbi:peptidoglycan DD-metalloendopeptidase family protein [Bosea sp. (in: a-proteobacteria)]|jgi:murein DD-endopeptidase MepM/ murein hydrolase activator NlpD|uniref:peptidoglycan DD-metalloendopeptidase family protein n=1 Tax=Bosea sp. (in: a-proteobacteria) TaxID=1871050 RepID=UPI002DDCA412|nr:peptidoglycan DD-metalloendopeptidase family protein [Bosea sp. (in: a-proteobacteria)]HEV2513135.1 peptidoglycan DD-metalloendopeptidase family protein [Bosea sp. (in: a-proteobacteria)]
MRKQVELAVSKSVVRAVSVCALAAGLGACSSDTLRFTEAPFSNPFQTAQAPASQRDPATTGSIGRNPPRQSYETASAAGNPGVRSQPLAPPAASVASRPAPPVAPAPSAPGSAAGWSAQGGTPIVVAHGETLDVISGRYGVPRAALMQANGLRGEVTPGSRVVVPVYNGGGAQTAARQPTPSDNRFEQPRTAPPPVSRPVASAPAVPAATPKVAAVDARAQAAQAKAQAAADAKEKAAADAKRMGEARARFAAEAKAKAAAKAANETKTAALPASAPVPATQPVKPKAAAPIVVANAPADKVTVQPKAVAPAPEPKAAEPQTTASLPKADESASSGAEFRWPARGRVITGYAGKGGNEGINIAVPEGTPVKAAEGGVVAYAGSELKGYGNLVLIRHPNGYVSAYAHNGELSVKRGEQVKRGQVVAKSGQSGNVNSPQLHFELRKGSTPVDPMPYLSSN